MSYHEIKIWPKFFEAVAQGSKNFEIRQNDRNYQPGDHVHLKEWDPILCSYTGKIARRKITYVLKAEDQVPGIQGGFCVFGMKKLPSIGDSV